MQNTKHSVDEKLEKSSIALFGEKLNLLSEAQSDLPDLGEPLEPVDQYTLDGNDDSDEESDWKDVDTLDSSERETTIQKNSSTEATDDSSDEENLLASKNKPPIEKIDICEGRVRRKAIFENDMDIDHLKVFIWQISHSTYVHF